MTDTPKPAASIVDFESPTTCPLCGAALTAASDTFVVISNSHVLVGDGVYVTETITVCARHACHRICGRTIPLSVLRAMAQELWIEFENGRRRAAGVQPISQRMHVVRTKLAEGRGARVEGREVEGAALLLVNRASRLAPRNTPFFHRLRSWARRMAKHIWKEAPMEHH